MTPMEEADSGLGRGQSVDTAFSIGVIARKAWFERLH